jgi:hypothetical protein
VDEEQYRYYGIGKKRTCPIPVEQDDDYTAPFSTYGYGDIEYWFKYCTFATLASVANPISGWATGFPPPIGPIPFPVVYIPIKAFSSDWGFIVIGITICGIFPYPWVLVANLSSLFQVPFVDPAFNIKAEIRALKKALSFNLKNYKDSVLKGYLNDLMGDANAIDAQISSLKARQQNHKALKPKQNMANYANLLFKWNTDEAAMREEYLSLKNKKYSVEIKYKIVYDAYSGSPVKDNTDPKIKSIQQTEKANDDSMLSLQTMVDSIESFVSPLPNATSPVSANFLPTIKNPQPVIKIATDFDNNIDSGVLDKITGNHKLSNDDFSDPNFNIKSQNSTINWAKYTNELKVAMYSLVISDPFPKYQNLKISNIPWMVFLVKDWVTTGAVTYGVPGFSPLPTS